MKKFFRFRCGLLVLSKEFSEKNKKSKEKTGDGMINKNPKKKISYVWGNHIIGIFKKVSIWTKFNGSKKTSIEAPSSS